MLDLFAAAAAAKPRLSIPQHIGELWRATIAWFGDHWVQTVIALAAGAVVYLLLEAMRYIGRRLCERVEDELSVRAIIGRVLVRTRKWFMVIVAARLVSEFAATPPTLHRTIVFIFTITTVLQVAIWVREVILGIIEYRTQSSEHSAETLGSAMTLIRIAVTAGVFAIALIVVLDNLGVSVTGLVAGLGIGGIAIGLAAQDIFKELFAALAIIFDKPFRKGDSIQYDTTSGTVEKIGLKTTRVRAITGEEKIISNSLLLDREISNMTRLERRRIKFPIGVIYQTPPEVAARIPEMLREVIEANGAEFVRAGFIGFGASSLDYEVEFDVLSPDWDEVYAKRHAVGVAILARSNAEGLEFAYPTQTSFTAAPDGELVLPYPEVRMLAPDAEPEAS
ncbi:MAG: mechanosensitive ion channel [Sphingomonadaceae bacterium]|nr:mechanosensitive ion channel [Sphingomonadaceae bacterium]